MPDWFFRQSLTVPFEVRPMVSDIGLIQVDPVSEDLRATVAAGILTREFRQVDPKIATFAILGSINWIARWYRPDGALRADELGSEFADHLVGGLTCSSPGAER